MPTNGEVKTSKQHHQLTIKYAPKRYADVRFRDLLGHKFRRSPQDTRQSRPPINTVTIKPKKNPANQNLPKPAIIDADALNNSLSFANTIISNERIMDENIRAVGPLSTEAQDDINRLIKRLTLSFTAKKKESRFIIKEGIFQDADFHIVINQEDLVVNVGNASLQAINLLRKHESLLQEKLALREINLLRLRFIS